MSCGFECHAVLGVNVFFCMFHLFQVVMLWPVWGARFSQPLDGMESLGISPVKESKCGIYEHEDLTSTTVASTRGLCEAKEHHDVPLQVRTKVMMAQSKHSVVKL